MIPHVLLYWDSRSLISPDGISSPAYYLVDLAPDLIKGEINSALDDIQSLVILSCYTTEQIQWLHYMMRTIPRIAACSLQGLSDYPITPFSFGGSSSTSR